MKRHHSHHDVADGERRVGDEQLAGHRQRFGKPPEALSTRCGGQGVVVFFGMAKPVKAPQIGPRPY
jgi:hypothetical protein